MAAIPRRYACALCCFPLSFSLWSSPALADEGAESQDAGSASEVSLPEPAPIHLNFDLEVGVSTWLSQGYTKWSHDASFLDPALGNPTSELEYKELWSNVVQLDGQATFRNGVFGRTQFGYGRINDGTLIDDDFASGQVLASRTESEVTDMALWYVTADVGIEVFRFAEDRGVVRAFLGYQHWEEEVVARGVTQLVSNATACAAIGIPCSPVGTVTNVGQKAVTNHVTWDSFRIGLEGAFQITRQVSVEGHTAFIPYTHLYNEDIHHLRADLRQDPSFSMSGSGIGVNAEAAFSYRILPPLSFNVGFRFWWLRVEDGTWVNYPVSSPPSTANLNEFESARYGTTVGFAYEF